MPDRDKKTVGSTADALVVIRAVRRARELGVQDPFAEWFVNEAGCRMAKMAERVDRVYADYNLVRSRSLWLRGSWALNWAVGDTAGSAWNRWIGCSDRIPG